MNKMYLWQVVMCNKWNDDEHNWDQNYDARQLHMTKPVTKHLLTAKGMVRWCTTQVQCHFALEWHYLTHFLSLHFMIWVSAVLPHRLQRNITLGSKSSIPSNIENKYKVNIPPISRKARNVYHITLHSFLCFRSCSNTFVFPSIRGLK